jgi:3-deoxy-7-phosphoheptulonate synthase
MILTPPYPLASKVESSSRTIIAVKGVRIGAGHLTVIAGPCAIESEEQIFEVAQICQKRGASILRGGAFKPRTSPYSFQGLGAEGLKLLRRAGELFDLVTISEVMDSDQIELVASMVDIIQVGARNMQNFSLLKKLGGVSNPIFLKRGLCATYQDLLLAAEYILSAGNPRVILCERGIRTYETHVRNTLDIAAVPILQELSHLPVFVDPSHGTGLRRIVPQMARAAVAAGADGIMVEVHPHPHEALSDGDQSLCPEEFAEMMLSVRKVEGALKE